jgi:hypothetical protein
MVIKALNTQNPFAGYGSIVTGSQFIGRKDAINAIHNRVLGESFGNIAIMGLPRIGKTSLAWMALMPMKTRLAQKQHYVSYIGIGTISNSTDFFKSLIQSVIEEFEFSDVTESVLMKISTFFDKLKEVENNRFEFINQVQKIFKFIKRNGLRLTYILDEFDNAENIFSVADFQILRELSSKPETQICLITVSRRTIQELEPENGAISNFYGVFADLRLGIYNTDDIKEYWENASKNGIETTSQYQEKVNYLVGRHPYLLDLFNYFMFNSISKNGGRSFESVIDETESELRLNLYNSFDSSLKLLKEESLYAKAFQLVLGPVYDVTTIDEQKLLKYEFIREVSWAEKEQLLGGGLGLKNLNNTSFICFSEYFTQYWKLKMYETDFWGLWKDTEIAIRDVIKDYLSETFSTNWEEGYLLKYPSEKRTDAINKLSKERDKYQKNFGSLASLHIVDYTYPKDMYDLFIANDWSWFSKVFTVNEKNFWVKVFNELAFLRNPVAHNNSQFVPINRINEAKSYCELILEKITTWRQNI